MGYENVIEYFIIKLRMNELINYGYWENTPWNIKTWRRWWNLTNNSIPI